MVDNNYCMGKIRITVFLDEDIWKRFQKKVYEKTESMRASSSCLEKIIKDWLDKSK
jgi:hypothetical protein